MTVKELIDKLKQFDENTFIYVYIPFTDEEQEIQRVYEEDEAVIRIEIDY